MWMFTRSVNILLRCNTDITSWQIFRVKLSVWHRPYYLFVALFKSDFLTYKATDLRTKVFPAFFLDCLTRTDRLSRNVGDEPPLYAV